MLSRFYIQTTHKTIMLYEIQVENESMEILPDLPV